MLKKIFWITLASVSMLAIGVISLLPTPHSVVLNSNSFIIKHAHVFDGEQVLRDATIEIRDGIIQHVGNDLVSDALPIIDASEKWLIPGLVDAHTHNFGSALSDSLNFGITTSIDMFTSADVISSAKTDRNALTKTDKADLFSAGMLTTSPGGHGTQFGIHVDTLTKPEQAAQWVARRQAEGSDFIKLVYMPNNSMFSSIDRATATAVIEAAHNAGLLAVAHIDTLDDATAMLESGIDGLVHVFADQAVSQEFLDLALENSIFVIPTLSVLATVDHQRSGAILANDPSIKPFLNSASRQQLETDFGDATWPGFNFKLAQQNVRRMHEAGIMILAGSDAPNPGTTYGASLHQELTMLVSAGLTPREALRAATILPMQAFGINDRGRISVGQRADFLLLDNNPIENINATRNLHQIYKNGFAVNRTTTSANVVSSKISSGYLSQFAQDLNGPSNLNWATTDDRMTGGNSSTKLRRTNGVLEVQANVQQGFMFPWAGAGLFGDTALDISDYHELSFMAKGSPGVYQALSFSGSMAGAPPAQTFNLTEEWQTFRLPLKQFHGLDSKQLIGFAIVAGPRPGKYKYSLKSVTLESQ
ncbi:amidohydrolase family protein [Arenicella xantha]|uniref:Imidazolonepropionase-like amidohydrolase n=1 Tax=Arenicella xantha TaxID=644221 RepID=A0A395JK59_9GAMM|nr:amidohydrolase family protein [Arenicella xantha]RBP49611.1 imidazolonepropionase-like amidohydrolase [Arenicella xantha]